MSDHEAPTTEAPGDEAPGNEALGDEAPADDASERVDPARQIAELEDAWRRTAAELDNFRKQCARDVARSRQQERAAVAASWLPVLDNLERALEHAASDPDSVVEGVRAVLAQAVGVLADLGYPRREDDGRAFNPAVHEAVGTVSDDALTPGTVARVVRPGYGPDEKLLRPAAVVVATRAP
ncbi:nucleotide exchange factor GrpE [Nocardioides sp. BP30]|uniref:nucleotide exchange factor GrpE n=1 Tax=Nocardioides sp. BP30 TaxID=3036374 RepID=UPI002468647A|nr:nucleotide exchange factor GrpE [Nocardioides sp. BP30]WGL50801.1 nucleotide exchange factor GrpE [Nocardioides sp. BP30]